MVEWFELGWRLGAGKRVARQQLPGSVVGNLGRRQAVVPPAAPRVPPTQRRGGNSGNLNIFGPRFLLALFTLSRASNLTPAKVWVEVWVSRAG